MHPETRRARPWQLLSACAQSARGNQPSNLPHSHLWRDARVPRRLAEIPIKGVHDGGTAGRQMKRVGKIGTLGVPVERVADLFRSLDHGIVGF